MRSFRSEIGVLYTDDFNRRVLERAFEEADVQFHPLFEASAHVFVGENHPLAKREIISPEELAAYPRYSFEQGTVNSFYYAEEPLAWLPSARNIRCSDRGTLSNLLVSHNGYTLSTGVLSSEMSHGIASVPLDADERMRVGYIMHRERRRANFCCIISTSCMPSRKPTPMSRCLDSAMVGWRGAPLAFSLAPLTSLACKQPVTTFLSVVSPTLQ